MTINTMLQNIRLRAVMLSSLALSTLLLGAADTEPPVPVEPEKAERNFTIRGSSLTIQPGAESTYLQFGGGIVFSAKDMHLSADMLELDVSSGSMQTQGQFSFPSMPGPLTRVVDDPGEIAQAMADELELPSASFHGNAIQRVGAKGNVKVKFMGMCLATSELVSSDGGRSWAANGRTEISSRGLPNNDSFSLAADYLLFDATHNSALAKGNIEGRYSGDSLEPVKIFAQRLELNQTTQTLIISGGVEIEYGSVSLSCGALLESDQSKSDANDVKEVGSIQFDLDQRLATASGNVVLVENSNGVKLSADRIVASLDEMWAEATGNPVVDRGDSTFSGERILVTDIDDKIVVEVSGPQSATLVPDEATPDKEATEKENPQENPGDLKLN